jgi:hypothetical protein
LNKLTELTALLKGLGLPVETGVFSGAAPVEYVAITPLLDDFMFFGDDSPEFESQEARLSLCSKGNYLAMKENIQRALLAAGFTITERRYIGHEDNSRYPSSAIKYSAGGMLGRGGLRFAGFFQS